MSVIGWIPACTEMTIGGYERSLSARDGADGRLKHCPDATGDVPRAVHIVVFKTAFEPVQTNRRRRIRAAKLMHGKTDRIHHDGKAIYLGMANPFVATRYHSLIIRPGTLPPEFEVTAWTADDEIMGVRHKSWPLEGVQYHPESFLTEGGERLLANFLRK